jgi:hypothetical protein
MTDDSSLRTQTSAASTIHLQESPLLEINMRNAAFKDHEKVASILQSFPPTDAQAQSMSQMMKNAALTDTKKNRAIINSLVADGRLLMRGRSRSTRYQAASVTQHPSRHGSITAANSESLFQR